MAIISHAFVASGGGGCGDAQYEVRWSAPGQGAEDFWFDRGELLGGGHSDAVRAYDQAHGLVAHGLGGQ
jgi:hypothetical protein